jgi:hypothetical protein
MATKISAAEFESLSVGKVTRAYFGMPCEIVELGPVREVLQGCEKGKKFRYIVIQGATAEIGFTVQPE